MTAKPWLSLGKHWHRTWWWLQARPACPRVTCVSPALEPGVASAVWWQLLSHGGPTCAAPPCVAPAVPAGSGGLSPSLGPFTPALCARGVKVPSFYEP